MRKPHKHAEVIKAWADGKEIQLYSVNQKIWLDCDSRWFDEHEYRIKPEQKPDVVLSYFVKPNKMIVYSEDKQLVQDNLQLTFDGETGELKSAEVLK